MPDLLKTKLGQGLVPALLSCAALLFSGSLLAHTEEAQFFSDQIPDPELPWWLAHDWYASSVAISGDTAAVGAAHEGGATSGVVYIYVRDGAGAWTEEAKIPNPSGVFNFGVSVSIHNDTLLVGAGSGACRSLGDAGGHVCGPAAHATCTQPNTQSLSRHRGD